MSLHTWGYWVRVDGLDHRNPSIVLGKNGTQNTPLNKGQSVSPGLCWKDLRSGMPPSPETHPSRWGRCCSWGSRHYSSPASGSPAAAASRQTTQRRVCPGTASRSISARATDCEADETYMGLITTDIWISIPPPHPTLDFFRLLRMPRNRFSESAGLRNTRLRKKTLAYHFPSGFAFTHPNPQLSLYLLPESTIGSGIPEFLGEKAILPMPPAYSEERKGRRKSQGALHIPIRGYL